MQDLQALFNWLGYGLCHQLPERSYIAGGLQAPVCARDTGIYLGFLIATAVIGMVHRDERPTGFPRAFVWVTMAALLAFMGWDGVSSYGGFRETTNWLRLATGVGVGFSIAALVVPMLNDVLWTRSVATRVLDPVWRFGVWLAMMPVTVVVVGLAGVRLGIAFPITIAMSVLATLTAVNLVIVGMLPWFDRKAARWTDLMAPTFIALGMALAEIAVAGFIRLGLERLVAGLAG